MAARGLLWLRREPFEVQRAASSWPSGRPHSGPSPRSRLGTLTATARAHDDPTPFAFPPRGSTSGANVNGGNGGGSAVGGGERAAAGGSVPGDIVIRISLADTLSAAAAQGATARMSER